MTESDSTLRDRIEAARARSIAWLDSMQAGGEPIGVARISAAHDPSVWPGMLLPGTYNAVICRALLGALPTNPAPLAAWLLRFRRPDGIFRVPGMTDATVFKKPDLAETWRYIDFHVTNYTLGALECLDGPAPVLDFARPYRDVTTLKAWLADRDLRDPWQEGNNIVNLGSFLLLLEAGDAMATLLAWHDYHQNPATGFWGVGQSTDALRALHAMAGSMHNYHLFYATGRPIPFHDRAIDYALSQPPVIDSACIDVDLVDLLVHGAMLRNHRSGEIDAWLRTLLPALLDFQNEDGGFADTREGVRRQDGWVGGYSEPQGLSNSFATWFRWIAIAMIADHLWPDGRAWHFRRMVGIGYRLPRPA